MTSRWHSQASCGSSGICVSWPVDAESQWVTSGCQSDPPALLSAAAAPSRRVHSEEVSSPNECQRGHQRVYNLQKQGTGPSVRCSLICRAHSGSLYRRSYSGSEGMPFFFLLQWFEKKKLGWLQNFWAVENMCGEGFFSPSSFHQPHKVILKHGQELEEEQEELAEHQPLEQEDLNFERWKRRPLPKRTLHQKIDDIKTYLWNAETNEFMGRSGKSWSELLGCEGGTFLCVTACVQSLQI